MYHICDDFNEKRPPGFNRIKLKACINCDHFNEANMKCSTYDLTIDNPGMYICNHYTGDDD